MPKCTILIGPPCSGKSTYAWKQNKSVISCDGIRELVVWKQNEGKYKFTKENEEIVWDKFYGHLSQWTRDIIIDNTNCRQVYLDKIRKALNPSIEWEIEYKYFPTPYWKLWIRNYIRKWKTGKWIPIDILRNMHNNFNKLYENMV